jgi:arylsulfatase A-like enzyme
MPPSRSIYRRSLGSQFLRATTLPLVLLLGAAAASAAEKRPNLIFIVADDLRWNTLGCMGDPVVKTPNIDRLAAQGVLFQNCFVTTSICWVSRASMFTGQWYSRHRIERGNSALTDKQWANSYPDVLHRIGYRTGFIGKFGVGSTKDLEIKHQSFDYWRGLPGQAGMFFDADDPTHTHKTARFGNEALEFLSGCTAQQPFCLSVSFNAPHARDGQPREYPPDERDEQLYDGTTMPVPELATDEAYRRLPSLLHDTEGRKRWQRRFDTPDRAQSIIRDYYRLITGIDREIGRMIEALASSKLADNTVIIFTSDNGYALGDRGMADKWFMYEEDLRIPLIVYDPRRPEAHHGRKVDAMTLNVDFAPTLLELAHAAIPSSMQGHSLVPILNGATPAFWRTDFFYEHHFSGAAAIPAIEGVRTKDWAYMRWTDAKPIVEELYDLRSDPLEVNDLVHNSASAPQLEALRTRWAMLKDKAK